MMNISYFSEIMFPTEKRIFHLILVNGVIKTYLNGWRLLLLVVTALGLYEKINTI